MLGRCPLACGAGRASQTVNGAHRSPVQYLEEPLREVDVYSPSHRAPCSLMVAFLDIWKEVNKPPNLGFLEPGSFQTQSQM